VFIGLIERIVSHQNEKKLDLREVRILMAKKQTIASEIGSAIGAAAARAEQLISSKPATKTTKPTAKRTTAAKHSANSTKTTAKAEPVVEVEVEEVEVGQPVAEAEIPALAAVAIEIDSEEIAKQAYLYWEARGFQGGNSAEDWVRAEEELKQRAGKTMSASV
jgi:Protein of unknown function (DUF2934)